MEEEVSFSAMFSKLKKLDTYKTIQDAGTKIMAGETKAGVPSSEGSTSSGTGVNSETAKPQLVARSSSNAVLVSPKQRGNPLLKSICSVPWEYDDTIVPDYVMGRTTCALFLSLRYHNLKPDYINERLRLLGKLYDLRVLLVQVDMKDPHHALKHLTRICLLAELTLMLAWSAEEAGKVIEMYKIFEHKPPDLIMERQESDPHLKLVNALTSIRSVNKTDATTLLTVFGSIAKLLKASPESLALVPGVGPQKASRIHRALHTPFLKADKRQKTGIAKYLDV